MEHPEILELTLEPFNRLLTPDELIHIATILGAFWSYDYEAAKQGRVGMLPNSSPNATAMDSSSQESFLRANTSGK